MEKALADKIATLDKELRQYPYGERPQSLYEPISYIMGLGGKRLRPLLVQLAGEAYGAKASELLKPAMAVEVFHNFTLVHDDLMDKAPLRRGHETVHTRWDETRAVLSGDVMLVAAYELLEELEPSKLKPAFSAFNKAARLVCEGQQLDMDFEAYDTVSEEQYLEMISLKTAALLAFSLQLGGIVAGVGEQEQNKLYQLGMAMGTGFQLMDDILDVFADQTKFGKQVGGDIISNKKTFLLLKALEEADGVTEAALLGWLTKTSFDPAEKVKGVTAIYEELGIKQMAEAKMQSYYKEGFELLGQLDGSTEQLGLLSDLFHYLSQRQK